MRTITLEELLEAGCHFGHQVTRQNPKARDYVFEARDNIHIIDLAKTKESLEEAAAFVKSVGQKGGTMILLGTKRQSEQVVKEEVKRAKDAGADGLFTVTQRWIGGIFTNYPEVAKNFRKLEDLTERLGDKNARAGYTKKEIALWERERQKLNNFYGGLLGMKKIPDAIFIIDTHTEYLAVNEARSTGVKTVGITDTNSDPTIIDYPIPANDDAVGSIKLITSFIVDAWIEGKTKGDQKEEPKVAKAPKEESPEEEVKTSPVLENSKDTDDSAGKEKDLEKAVKNPKVTTTKGNTEKPKTTVTK